MKLKPYILSTLLTLLLLIPTAAKADNPIPPDAFGHEIVSLCGGYGIGLQWDCSNSNEKERFTYLNNNTWVLKNFEIPEPTGNGWENALYIGTKANGTDAQLKIVVSDNKFVKGETLSFGYGSDIYITSADAGNYDITIVFSDANKGTIRFDPPGSEPSITPPVPSVTTKAYRVLDNVETETDLTGGTINIPSENTAKSLYFKVEQTEGAETTTTYYTTAYYNNGTNWGSQTTLTKSTSAPTPISLPAYQYVYDIEYGSLEDLPDSPTITISQNIPQFKALYLNDQEFISGSDYRFTKNQELNFQIQMTDGSFVALGNNGKDETLGTRNYTLVKNSSYKITAPNDAEKYIWTLTATPNADKTQWTLRVEKRAYITGIQLNSAEYQNGTHTFTNGQSLEFKAVMSDGTYVTYKPNSDTTLADGTYTLTKNGTGNITAPNNAADYVYRLRLDHSDDSAWTLTVSSRTVIEEESDGLSSTLPDAMINYTNTWSDYVPDNDNTMWYTDQLTGTNGASETNSFLLGNGSLGVCLSGANGAYSIALSEKGCFTGNPTSESGNSLGMATLTISNNSSKKPLSSFVHQLDLTKAVYSAISHEGNYTLGVEALASFPDQVFAMRFTDTENSNLSLTFNLAAYTSLSATSSGSTKDGQTGTGWISGTVDYTSFAVYYKVVANGGDVSVSGSSVTVTGANNIVLYLAGATNIGPGDASTLVDVETLINSVSGHAESAASKGWISVYGDHVDDYSDLYSTCELKLDGQTNNMATNLLQSGYDNATLTDGQKRMYEELVFAYGRYLAIASNRPYNGSIGINVPTNLQGIWVPKTGMWNGDIHADINVQMNYWASESTNLAVTHEPFVKWIAAMANTDSWKNLAKEYWRPKTGSGADYYNAPSNILNHAYSYSNLSQDQREYVQDGWTCKTTLNPFGGATSNYYHKSGGSPSEQSYHTAQAWLSSHIIQHYLYSLDNNYAREALPALWGACRFWAQTLSKVNVIENSQITSYTYEAPYEVSPEQDGTGWGEPFYRSGATAHAQQMIYYLFQNTIDMIETVGLPTGATSSQYNEIKEIFAHLDNGLNVWTDGGTQYLREWKYFDTFGIKNHRHLSHLGAMYPLGQIKPDNEVFNPTINAMLSRGLGVGDADPAVWTTSWKVCLWAHAGSSPTYNQYAADIYKSTIGYYSKAPAGTGLYVNLTSHNQCMQMEGNWGLTAGVAEMLMQSNMGDVLKKDNPYGYIDVAPALPSYWPTGQIKGLKAIGNYEVSYEWKNGVVQKVTVTAKANNPVPFFVHFGDLSNSTYHVSEISGAQRLTTYLDNIWDADHSWKFSPSQKGAYVVITLGAGEDVEPETPRKEIVYTPAPAPNTSGLKSVNDSNNKPMMHVMFGTSGVNYLADNTFTTGSLAWSLADADADLPQSPDNFTGYASATSTALPYTEVNGLMAKEGTKDGGMFLTPVSGDFIRLEPLYTGTATLWLRQTGKLYVMDEDGKIISVASKSTGVGNQDTDGGYNVSGTLASTKYTIDVKGGKTYYVATPEAAMGFVAADFAKSEYTASSYSLYTTPQTSSQTWPAVGATVNYTVNRDFTAGYCHPIVLPFSVSESMLKDIFGAGTIVMYLDPYAHSSKDTNPAYLSVYMPAIGDNTLYFTVHFYQMLYANVPAFIIPARSVSNPTFANVTYAGNTIRGYAIDSDNNFTVTGSYTATAATDNKEMYYINNTGGSSNTVNVYHSAQGVDMKPTRVWISARSTTTQAPPRLTGIGFHDFSEEDSAAALLTIESDTPDPIADDRVYNMLGIPVAIGSTDGLSPGIYIHRGRKILVR